jgi:proteic killer suppression protein
LEGAALSAPDFLRERAVPNRGEDGTLPSNGPFGRTSSARLEAVLPIGHRGELMDKPYLSSYTAHVIRSFRHKGLKRLFEIGDAKGISADLVRKVENILAVLNRARRPEDMNLPGFRLHPLKGARKGQWSVVVRANWRVVFRLDAGGGARR